jgi:hypothetical protein
VYRRALGSVGSVGEKGFFELLFVGIRRIEVGRGA